MSNPNDGPPKDQKLLFGNIAISQGFVTHAQIDECKRYQDQQRAQGAQPDRIGDLLVNRGYLTPAQVKEIFRIQGREGGHTQISGYELIEQIGKGAMGVVYRARQVSMERIVAIKILYPKLARNTSFVDRFISEARASARLNHPNIITGIDVGESNGIYYFAMEYVDGRTVQDILKRGGSIDEKRALAIVMQIGRALDHATRHKIVHRDIKPDNIMIAADGSAKLCDLGLARVVDSAKDEQGVTLGTPNYISPEQARGEADIDTRSDIYSLGCTLFHMLTGQTPYQGGAAVVMSKHINDAVPDPRSVMPDITGRTSYLCMQMMAKERTARPQTPKDLVAAVEVAMERLRMGDAATAAAANSPRPPASEGGRPVSGMRPASGMGTAGTAGAPPRPRRRRGGLGRRRRRI